jgi:glucose/arabinose dehydrogenase/type 1 glutamine amidotransferase
MHLTRVNQRCGRSSLLLTALALLFSAVWLEAAPMASFNVLVFSKTAGFRHDSIPKAIQAIRELAVTNDLSVQATEDSAQFTDANLRQFRCVIFCLTTGDVLNEDEQAAFQRYIRSGGGYVGIHSASDTEHDWAWYGQLVGAYFKSHPAIQQATVKVLDPVHPSTAPLPRRWPRTDEWYSFDANPRGRVLVLATLDETSYEPSERMGFDHPTAWCHEFEGGRAWYTGGGHTEASYDEISFRQHILGGILWAAKAAPGDAGATLDANFHKLILDDAPNDPMQLALDGEGRVFYVERHGALKIWKPDLGRTVLAAQLAVDDGREDGLLGIALDPGFADNHWLYLFYSPTGSEPVQHVSRFSMVEDRLDRSSEKVLLTIPVQRETCCHSGGGLGFGPGGELYIGVGDNTNPFESSGFSPLDERPNRSSWDSQRSAGNANDLRGKILRIKPEADGTYSIPAGNLFPPGTPNTRPEIYTMGNRNPFRFSIDTKTSWLYWGEVGPDSTVDDPTRGPQGYDEWNQARSAGNYGWPYFVADNKPYHDYDFASGISGPPFDPALPQNHSPNNTGPTNLPPARPAWIWYPYGNSAEFPEITGGAGRTAMAGPVYHYSSAAPSNNRRLPAYYEGSLLIYEWSRNFIREVKLDETGNILAINPFLPSFTFIRPMDLKVGPDGALYLIEWGSGFGGGNADAKIVRVDYASAASSPVVSLQSTTRIEKPFTDEPDAVWDAANRAITIPLPASTRFYRLASPVQLRVAGFSLTKTSLILKYEEPGP